MTKHHSRKSQDAEEEEKKLSEFQKLFRVCKITVDLYNRAKFQQAQGTKHNNITASIHPSLPTEIGSTCSFYKPQVSKRSCNKAGGEPSLPSSFDSEEYVFDHNYLRDKGKRPVDDHDYLNEEEVLIDRKGKKKLRIYCDGQDYEYSEKKVGNYNVVARNKFAEIAPLLPLEFESRIQEMGGDDVKLIIHKHLFAADIKQDQNRFSIPVKQMREDAKDFLTLKVPLEVPLIDPNLKLTQITIRKWNYSSKSSSYTLSGPWSGIARENNLRAGMVMQLWSFRVDGELHLALVKVSRDNEQNHETNDNADANQINVEPHDAAAASNPNQLNDID